MKNTWKSPLRVSNSWWQLSLPERDLCSLDLDQESDKKVTHDLQKSQYETLESITDVKTKSTAAALFLPR